MPNDTTERTLKPLGNLSLFPREVRDEIYRHVFPKSFGAYYSSTAVRPAFSEHSDALSLSRVEHDRRYRIESNLSILRLSKAIKDEALSLLYSEGIFKLQFSTGVHIDTEISVHSMVNVTNCMANVKISVWNGSGFVFATWAPLDSFVEDSITRKSILVDFRLSTRPHYTINVTESPLIIALKRLTGSNRVELRLTALSGCYSPPQGTSEATIKEWEVTGQWEKLYTQLEQILGAMGKALEPTLGKSSAMSELETEANGIPWLVQRYIVFRPHDHLVANSKAKGDTTDLQQPMGTERID